MQKYTLPRLYKGKPVKHIPKGSSKLKEEAKQIWYVNYSFEGKQIRVKGDLNRIQDHKEKEFAANILLESIKQDLANGYNPNNELEWVAKTMKETTTLADAILQFKEYHSVHKSRKKTIATYISKLNALSKFYPKILLAEITTKKLQYFILSKIADNTYSQNSVKSAKRTCSAFFNFCLQAELIQSNPINGFDKKIRSSKETVEKHVPFSQADIKLVLEYLDNNDKYAAFFCRMIYFTCLRPGEIRGLTVANIDLVNKTITIPASVRKVTKESKEDVIEINESFMRFLKELKLETFPPNYFLTGSTTNIVGEHKVGENTPYNKLMAALKNLELDKKGYDLYSFKHTSNIFKYTSGWTLAEIMKANRHSSITMTEIYLRKLGQFVETQNKLIPII